MSFLLPINHHLDRDLKCPHCEVLLITRTGKYGKFYACPNYPKCKYTCSVESDERERTYDDSLVSENELLNG